MFGEHSMIRRRALIGAIGIASVTATLALFGCSSSVDPNEDIQAPTTVQFLSGDQVAVGDTIRILATAYSKFNGQVAVTWSWKSSSTAVATVDTSGLVKGVSVGQSTITGTATAVGKSASSTVVMSVVAK